MTSFDVSLIDHDAPYCKPCDTLVMNPETRAGMTPRALGLRWPAEWDPHAATWLSWPHNRDTWPGAFDEAIVEYSRFVEAIASFEPVRLLASAGPVMDAAANRVGYLDNVTIFDVPTNDAWMRDHGPIFIVPHELNGSAGVRILDWRYNAWGNKYPPFHYDDDIARRISQITTYDRFIIDFVLEGGAIDGNGKGVVLTTESCMLNPNRNRSASRGNVCSLLHDYLGADHVLWLDGSIPGDDTDGHIDQLARFVNETTVVVSTSDELPRLRENLKRIQQSSLGLTPIELPMPSAKFRNGMCLPTSYANFYILNGAVIVPEFGDPNDSIAKQILSDLFTDRDIIGLPAGALSVGLGAFHCLSQQQPAAAQSAKLT